MARLVLLVSAHPHFCFVSTHLDVQRDHATSGQPIWSTSREPLLSPRASHPLITMTITHVCHADIRLEQTSATRIALMSEWGNQSLRNILGILKADWPATTHLLAILGHCHRLRGCKSVATAGDSSSRCSRPNKCNSTTTIDNTITGNLNPPPPR